ncbi:Ig-like domain-containing protein [Deinococcus roseus]|uniref:Ig-like domain-containing protein n=1 Tax=Deinococcus roseus TaxID=392414 RepID=A0ABQ2CT12_9DEIO|nr:Ig-like domain-containing protein [Deinococcus roseus]GGJ18168.1 hypothetical protein GCM10008938_00370 [Deinococcus roseus]
MNMRYRPQLFVHALLGMTVLAGCNPPGPAPDKTPPSVTLSASSTAVTAPGTVKLTAAATDNVGVKKVEFYEGANKLGEDTSAPYELNLNYTKANNGDHTYTAKAFDAANNTGTSNTVKVNVNIDTIDSTTPNVLLFASKTNVTVAESVKLTADATDNVGIQKVDFYEGDTLISTDTTAPYEHTFNYTQVQNGIHTYKAQAFDTSGNSTLSAPVTVTVNILADAVKINPRVIQPFLAPGGSTEISAQTLTNVTFSIEEGGGTLKPKAGTGVATYTAPLDPTSSTATIRVTSNTDPSNTATVKVYIIANSGVYITSSNVKVEQGDTAKFAAKVLQLGSGSPDPVHWRVVSGGGTITDAGLYTAPLDSTGPVLLEFSQGPNVKATVGLEVVANSGVQTLIKNPVVSFSREGPATITITSTYEIKEVEVTMVETGKTSLFTLDAGQWKGTVDYSGLPAAGEYHLKIRIKDALGNERVWLPQNFRDPAPVVSNLSMPSGDYTTSGPLQLSATCTDNTAECMIRVLRNGAKVMAVALNTLDVTLDLTPWAGQDQLFTIEVTDKAGNRVTAATYNMHVVHPQYVMFQVTPGPILDLDSGRLLYDNRTGLQPVLTVRAFNSGGEVSAGISPYTDALLTPFGVVARDAPAGGMVNLYDSRNPGTPFYTGPLSNYRVAGEYLLWEDPVNKVLYRKNLSTGVQVQVPAERKVFTYETLAVDPDPLAANGVFVWVGADGQLYAYNNGSFDQWTHHAAGDGTVTEPTTDGTTAVFALVKSGKFTIVSVKNGVEETLGQSRSTELNHFGTFYRNNYLINSGYIAYTDPDASGVLQVWLKRPDGIKQRMTFFTSMSRLVALGPQGQLLIQNGSTLYSLNPEGNTLSSQPFAITDYLPVENYKYFAGKWHFIYRNVVYQVP